jgi:hypothetical protein
MGRPGRSRCALCGMGKRAGITSVCMGCGRPVCPRHTDLNGPVAMCTRCARDEVKLERVAGMTGRASPGAVNYHTQTASRPLR